MSEHVGTQRWSLYKTAERVSRWLATAGIACLLAAMLVTVADIVLRGIARISLNVFDVPLNLIVPGIVDITQLFIMATAYLSMPYAFMIGSHVAVDLLTDKFPPRWLALVRGVGAMFAAAVMAAISWYGLQTAMQQHGYGDSSHTIAIPILWYWGPLLIGAFLSTVATVLLAFGHLARAATGRA